jgi:hypothetical protein
MGNRKLIISEEQYNYLMNEMAYPTSFNMDVFKNLPTFAKRIEYCQSRLQRLSSGSSRIVYKVDNEKVLKLAKNRKGIAQNECEASDYYKKSIGCFAEVYEYDDNYLWIEMQFARKAKLSDFKRILGVDFKVVCDFIMDYWNSYSRSRWSRPISPESKKIFDSEWFQEQMENYSLFTYLAEYLGNYQPDIIGDLMRLSSWGVVTDNGEESLVIIDFGLDDNVYNEYYR